MIENFLFSESQHLIAAKLFLFIFLSFGLIAIFTKKIKPWIFLSITGILLAAGYYSIVNGLHLSFWGLTGDEITIAGMYNTFAHLSFLSDFAYHDLPPFYPPLYFWSIALLGKILSLNGIGLAKLGGVIAYLFFPISVYLTQKFYWLKKPNFKYREITFLTSPLLILLFINIDEAFGKPYELFTATAIIYWLIFLYLEIKKEKWSIKKTLIFGFTGGIIFMTYYLWMVFAVIALSFLGLTIDKKNQWSFLGRSFMVLSAVLIFSTPFLFPLISSYAAHGTENWQAGFFTIDNINWKTLFFDELNWRTIAMFFGFLAIVYNYKKEKYQPLIATITTTYVWWAMGLCTLALFQVPLQEFRGFYYFMPATLAIGLSFGLAELWSFLDRYENNQKIKTTLSVSGMVLFAQFSIFGSFIDNNLVRDRLVKSKLTPARIENLSNFLNKNKSEKITLNVVPELLAFTPINNYLYFNQHNSHPAANYSKRFSYLKEMITSSDAKEFYAKSQNTPFGKIQRLILFRYGKNFPLYFQIDKMMVGFEEVQLMLPTSLVNEKFFRLVYKFEDYEIWDVK